ncbi:MAG: efflux RND transporter permease subunit [Myxococcales bacterium]|nr:efflux RND transporter permease subunit [Myxococcales bacterium]
MKTSEGSIMRKFIFSFAIVVMAGLTTGCAKREPGPPPGPRAVRVALARTESAATGGSYAGSLEPRTRLNLAFGVPGRVRSLGSVRDGGKERPLREGDRVTKGQVLALLDDSDLQHQAASSSLAMSTASADLASSEASLAQAEADLVRARGLAASGAVPGAELERAETLAKAARGRTAALRAQKGSRGEQVAIARRAASDARLLSPIEQVARLSTEFEPQKIVRQDLERTITVGAVTKDGELASALFADAKPAIDRIKLPPGYSMTFGGEQEMQAKAFASVSIALKVSVALIFLTLVWQFANVFKPLIVFAAIPFGMVGVVLGLVVTKTNFGFMAFLGVTSLIGVIVSHIIVLFDFIEEAREHGTELHRAVIDAGLVRLRPVLVTVLATVGGLVPLALEGGPMWRQLVYVQIGGLLLATLVTKGVVPLLYVLFVETLHLVEWKNEQPHDTGGGQ